MTSCKEWLNTKTHEYKQAACMFGHSEWLEIPEGAEIAIKFKYDPDEFGVIFYKNNGKSCFSQNDKSWQNHADWTMKDLLNENYCEDGIDLSHDVLWQRATHPEELPFIDDEPKYSDDEVKYMDENGQGRLQSINDQYAEIDQVRQAINKSWGSVGAASGGVDATLAERQAQYGCYEDVAHVTQQILSVLRIGNYDELPAPMKESLHMIASKMARIVNGDPEYLDNWHDIGGYAKLIEKLIKGE